uniref:Uncharacterized protein n=1 Tax=Rhizophora mucronata TaxID=61149 RepID=A0A2P2NQV5_RHIMU
MQSREYYLISLRKIIFGDHDVSLSMKGKNAVSF